MRTRFSRRLTLAAIALLTGAALFVAGCGGSADTTTTTAADTATTAASSVGESGSIFLDGLVDYPMTLTVLDMDYMYWITVTADHPELGPTEYEGVLLSDIFSYVGVQSDATTLLVTAADGSKVEIPLTDISSEDAMIAVADDGTMNAVMPGLGSEAWVEDVVAMEFK